MPNEDWEEKLKAMKAVEKERAEERMLMAEVGKMIGRIQMGNFICKIGTSSNLIFLKRVKENKIYKKIPEIKTWENFCKLTGYTVRWVDESLKNLEIFGQEFLEISSEIGLTSAEFRKLRQLPDNTRRELLDGKLVDLKDKEEIKAFLEDLVIDKHQVEEQAQKKEQQHQKDQVQIAELDAEKRDLQAELVEVKAGKRAPERYWNDFKKADTHIREALEIISSLPVEVCRDDFDFGSMVTAAVGTIDRIGHNLSRTFIDEIAPDD